MAPIHPLELSALVLDSGETDQRTNRITNEISEINDRISIVESFSHIITFRTDAGLVSFDSSGHQTGTACVDALRQWSDEPVDSIVYTHGHIDHVGGSGAFAAAASAAGHAAPNVIAHTACAPRFQRYIDTDGYNTHINVRQFGGVSKRANMGIGGTNQRFLPEDVLWPTTEVETAEAVEVGGTTFELFHDKGETDDHLWAWVPSERALCVGDFVTWVFPNCGNPQKVQRFPLEWARALRKMQAYDADLLFGAHGLPVQGADRINRLLDDLASALEHLGHATIEMMNDGADLDTIVHAVNLDDDVVTRPWMRPIYDEPEFVVRNIWRLYGGWWDLNPARLKPAPRTAIGAEIVRLAGGEAVLVARARELADAGDFRLACELIEHVVDADPASTEGHGARAEIYQARRNHEAGLMSKGIFAAAANESRAALETD